MRNEERSADVLRPRVFFRRACSRWSDADEERPRSYWPPMRFLFPLLFLAAGLAQAESSPTRLTQYRLYGKEYVLMTDWARSAKMDLKWIVKEKLLRATNASTRLSFEMDSYAAQLNGINLKLCLPVVLKKGVVYISQVDLESTLHPLLFPKKMDEGDTIKTICLDAGHGGSDPGKIDGTRQEKKYTLLLAEEVERLLKKEGFKVIQTRERDERLETWDRPKFANQNKADLFISLHFNAAANRNVQGAEVYCLTPEGTISSNGGKSAALYPGHHHNAENTLLAYQMQKSLVKKLNVEDRSVKRAQYVVLLTTKMPAILIEGGFMSNPAESKRIYGPAYRQRMAQAIVQGILSYKKIVQRDVPNEHRD